MEKITAEEAARRLGITQRTLWRWRDAGKIAEAGRVGRSVLFYTRDVDALRSVDAPADITLADVYMRLAGADSWEEVHDLRDEVAATLCARTDQEGREAIAASWAAACSMAATHPEESAQERWVARARQLGGYIGKTWAETDEAIGGRRSESYEDARQELDMATLKATQTPDGWISCVASAYTIADNDPPGSTATASGVPLDESVPTVAMPMSMNPSRFYGSKIEISYNGISVVATVTDCGYMGGGSRGLDLTPAIFRAFGFGSADDWGLRTVSYRFL